MANYAEVYRSNAKRAIQIGMADLEAFVDQLQSEGVPVSVIEQMLLDDLHGDGPIFGKFFRAMGSAAEESALAAYRQGATLGTIDTEADKEELMRIFNAEDTGELDQFLEYMADKADPNDMTTIEREVSDKQLVTWNAEMRNSCAICLALHGTTMTRGEFRELGYEPGMVHRTLGWLTKCFCWYVPAGTASRDDTMAPLVRVKDKTEGRSKRTVRAVSQEDANRALAAAKKAMESRVGDARSDADKARIQADKKALREMGSANESKK